MTTGAGSSRRRPEGESVSGIGRSVAAAGSAVLWSAVLLPRCGLGIRGRTAANAAFATTHARVFGGCPNWRSGRGLRWGAAAATLVGAGYAAALAVPPLRGRLAGFAERAPQIPPAEWIAVHIPFGTVYSEELIFRGTLDPLLAATFGERGQWLAALSFGLWHIHPARAAGDNVALSVSATAAAGLVLSRLRRHVDSATAPALVHLSLNVAGALAPQLASRLLFRVGDRR